MIVFKFNRKRTLFLEGTCLARAKSVPEFHSEAPDPMGTVSSSLGPRSRNCLIALYPKVFRISFLSLPRSLRRSMEGLMFHHHPTECPARFKNDSRQSFLNKLQVLLYLQTKQSSAKPLTR